jgi:predicted outer membrane lipoprotein
MGMKIIGIVFGGYFAYLEFRSAIEFWLPAFGEAAEQGYFWGQPVILGILGACVFGSLVALAYRFLSEVLD